MLNMVIFRLVNTNITVIWAVNSIVQEQKAGGTNSDTPDETTETPMVTIQGLILSLVLSKAASPILTRYGLRIAKF